jgi:apurinic endonuclease APN1
MKRDISSDRVTFCLDTAHALAYGYEFRTEETAKQFSEKVEQTIGWSSVSAIHLNDSKIDLGKKNDRHENIGEGFIGSDGFYSLFTQIHQLNIPLVLETPGFDENGPDKENIDRVKTLRRLLEESK